VLDPLPTVEVSGTNSQYYVLYRNGQVVASAWPASRLALGTNGPVVLRDLEGLGDQFRYYRVESRPLSDPLDLDRDGIDDVFELRFPSALDPLDPEDQGKDPDGDGLTNLQEYQERLNPLLSDITTVVAPRLDQVAAGLDFIVALKRDGSVWTQGINNYGQLGNGSFAPRTNVMVRVQGGLIAKGLAAGTHHALALDPDGRLWSWGRNNLGQLGISGYVDSGEPKPVVGLTRWTQVSAGYDHTLAVDDQGRLYAWGGNQNGQIGDGTLERKDQPVRISDEAWRHIVAAESQSMAIRADGTLWAWGFTMISSMGERLPVKVPTQIGSGNSWARALSIGLALRNDGRLMNPLGDGPFSIYATNRNWIEVSHSGDLGRVGVGMAVDRHGGLWMSGGGRYGWVNDGLFSEVFHPYFGFENFFPSLTGRLWLAAKAKENKAVALAADGTLWRWDVDRLDSSESQAMERNRHSPVRVVSDRKWAKVYAGGSHSLGFARDGSIWAWGANRDRSLSDGFQLGDGTATFRGIPFQLGRVPSYIAPPRLPPSGDSAALGPVFTYLIDKGGSLWGVGNWLYAEGRDSTQLETGPRPKFRDGPFFEPFSTNRQWSSISASSVNILGIEVGGALWAVGRNNVGQLGDGTTNNRSRPVRIGGNRPWTAVQSAGLFSVGIQTDGSLWTWGGASGLGDNSLIARSIPTKVGADRQWTDIAVSDGHALAISSDGSLWTWGANNLGQLGNGSQTPTLLMIRVHSLQGCRMAAAGNRCSFAIDGDGRLWAWGSNAYGALGDGTTVNRLSPVIIAPGKKWIWVSTGRRGINELGPNWAAHTLAIDDAGDLWAWGANDLGQLGDGTAAYLPQRTDESTDWGLPRPGGSNP
jgi:alpha-tubulin suppressor-like RCC1 family protein